MAAGEIIIEIKDSVALVTISRPAVRNALSASTLEDLAGALDRVDNNPAVRAMIITGSGSVFCAGAELTSEWTERSDGNPPDRGLILEEAYNPLLLRMRDFRCPIVAAVNGAAAGGGCAFSLSADIVIASRSAFFVQPFASIGLVPDVGSTWLLPRLVGRARAAGMMLLGERISSQKAFDWGLIWDLVDDAELMPEAFRIAAKLSRGPSTSLRLTRQAMWKALEMPLGTVLQLERDNQRAAGLSHDHAEGVAAFLMKRPPVFSGN